MTWFDAQPPHGEAASRDERLSTCGYIRFAALGDSASCGVGDPTPDGLRGWAQILADAIAADHHVSSAKLAVSGATVADVRRDQLADALDHRPHIASLVVGLNDAMRSTWDPEQIREDLLHMAGELARTGALVITVRFHDHTRVIGLPGPLAAPMRHRIQVLNEIYDEVHERFGAVRLDLSADPGIYDRDLWAFDRLHPSELGHRRLARAVARLLVAEGLEFELPSLTCTSAPLSAIDIARNLALEVAPWLARRISDLAPAAARGAIREIRGVLSRSR